MQFANYSTLLLVFVCYGQGCKGTFRTMETFNHLFKTLRNEEHTLYMERLRCTFATSVFALGSAYLTVGNSMAHNK